MSRAWEHAQRSPGRFIGNSKSFVNLRLGARRIRIKELRKHPDRNADDAWKSRAWEHVQTSPGRQVNVVRKTSRQGVNASQQSSRQNTSIDSLLIQLRSSTFTSTPYQRFESLEIKSIPCVGARPKYPPVGSHSTRSLTNPFWVLECGLSNSCQ